MYLSLKKIFPNIFFRYIYIFSKRLKYLIQILCIKLEHQI